MKLRRTCLTAVRSLGTTATTSADQEDGDDDADDTPRGLLGLDPGVGRAAPRDEEHEVDRLDHSAGHRGEPDRRGAQRQIGAPLLEVPDAHRHPTGVGRREPVEEALPEHDGRRVPQRQRPGDRADERRGPGHVGQQDQDDHDRDVGPVGLLEDLDDVVPVVDQPQQEDHQHAEAEDPDDLLDADALELGHLDVVGTGLAR